MVAEVMHEEGHTMTVTADIPLDDSGMAGKVNKTPTHATGSSFSYGRNYLIRLIFNIPTGDEDDGNGGKTYITEEQLSTIIDLMNDRAVNVKKFLEYMEVESLETIPASDYQKAVSAIKAKKK